MQPVSKSVRAANLATVSHPIPGKSRACRVITAACGVLIAMAPGLCAEGAAQTKAATATTLAVTSGGSAVSTVTSGSVVTLTATVKAGAAALTTGQVNFCDATASHCTDIHLLGAAQLTGAGAATLKFRPGIGSHSYKAVFLGTTSNAGSASPASELTATGTIPSLATTTTINQTGSWGAYKLSAAVTEIGNTAPPNGTISFLDTNHGNAALGTGTLGSAARGVAWSTVNTSALSVAGVTYSVSDLNGDGIPDLFFEDYFGTYDVLLGNGDGTFKVLGSPFGPSSEVGSFVIGDFNNDGIPDVAAITGDIYAASSTITIFLGNGDGTFTVAASPALGYNPTAIATADINGDGNADLIVSQEESSTSSDGQIAIFLGNGDGTFTQASSTTSLTSVASSVLPADLNKDGNIDLVLTGVGQNGITILLGKGDGTFTSLAGPGQLSETMVSVADVNNDGTPDLVFASSSTSYLTVFLGNGDGTFTAAPSSPDVNLQIGKFAIGDFNQDGIPDIVYDIPNTTTAAIVFGKGDGSFIPTPGTLSYSYDFSGYLLVADFNGDGWPDILTEDGNSRTVIDSLTEPTETANASTAVSIPVAGAHLADATYAGDADYTASASGDISLWGVPPVTTTGLTITSEGKTVSSVAPGTSVTLTATVTAGASPLTPGQVNFCDAQAPDCSDIHLLGTVAVNSTGAASFKFVPGAGANSYKAVFQQDGYGLTSTSAAVALSVGPAPKPTYSDTTEISSSGVPGNYTLTATVLGVGGSAAPTGNVSFLDTSFANASLATAALGTATPGLGWLISQAPALTSAPTSEVAGDFNGDGIPDLALLWSPGIGEAVTILFGKGDGTFTTGPTIQTQLTGQNSPAYMIAGDFNGDGKTDLCLLTYGYSISAGNEISTVTTLLGKGDGTFAISATSTAYNQPSNGGDFIAGSMVAADFNGDGKLDLAIVGDYVSWGGITILSGNGDGTFTAAGPNVELNLGFEAVATGDFNGDGIPDLVALQAFEPGGAVVLLGQGDGSFTAVSSPPTVGTFLNSLVVGDFNGDGKSDLAIGYSGGVGIYLGKGDGTFSPAAGTSLSGAGESLVTGDFNHDGKLDLAAIGSYSSQIQIYVGAGDGTFTPTLTTPAVSQGGFPTSIVAADFNEDGIPDLALLTQYSYAASILLTEPTQTATVTVNGVAPAGPGTHFVEASYAGDTNYPASISSTTTLTAGVALPVISPAAGTITTAQSITITDSTPGATIYYQAYGAIYTGGFVQYTGPIPMEGSGSLSIQAYATETGYQGSQNATAAYILNFPNSAATPVISLASGSYPGTQTVTITDATPGAQIYYSTNGTYPYTNSNLYSGAITVSNSEIVTAVALAPGYASSSYATAQYDIDSVSTRFAYTIAGNQTPGHTGDGGAATIAELTGLEGVAVDSAGNVYIADTQDNVVRKVAASTGIITTIAGTGTAGHTGDNGPAASAELWYPSSLAVDATGNLFIAEDGDFVVRRIDAATGTITTFAGSATGTGSLGGPANNYALYYISGIACDLSGNLFIAEFGEVFEVSAGSGIITELAGYETNAGFGSLNGITVDGRENVYVSDSSYSVVDKIAPGGTVSVFAGSRNGAYGGDGGPATKAGLYDPAGLAVDQAGNVYIADFNDFAIREVNTSGIINTIAGVLLDPFLSGGDGNPATNVGLYYPRYIAADKAGNVYFSDQDNYRIRKFTAPTTPPASSASAPVFSLSAGSFSTDQTLTITEATPGAEIYVSVNGAAPTTSNQGYHGPIQITGTATVQALAIAPGYLVSTPVSAAYTITTPPTAVISTVAGDGKYGMLGVGGPAINAKLGQPEAVTFDSAGNLYIVDTEDNVVWEVAATTGNITIVAGTGTLGATGDGGPATAAELYYPEGVAVDNAGDIYIADTDNGRIRMVAAKTGVITTVAGPGVPNTLGDGGLATSAYLGYPDGLALDSAGNLYIAGSGTNRIRMINPKTGIISTVAGGGTSGKLGDGGLATAAILSSPYDVTVDSVGNLYISDSYDGRIRKVDASTGVISTVAGNGNLGNTGDGGPATSAEIYVTQGIAMDAAGDIYLSNWPDAVRKVDATTGIITTIAGDGYFGYGGDGGAATMAELNYPQGLALDSAGSIYIADPDNYVVRKVTFPVAPAITWPVPAPISYGTALSATQLDATSKVAGTFVYSPPAGTVLGGGAQTLSATFTPTDTIDYKTATDAVQFTVNKAMPAIAETLSALSISKSQALTVTVGVSAANAGEVPTGTVTLTGGGYTSAAASLSGGSATINIPAGSLSIGSDSLDVAYTPDTASADNYTSATQSAEVTVTASVGTAAATLTVTPTAATITNDETDKVAVVVAGTSGQATPTGTVTLASGSFTAQLQLSSGSASFLVPAGALSSGANTLTATYSGDATYATGSGTAAITVSQVIVSVPAPSPVSPGASVTATATFTAGSSYSGTMNLTCTLAGSPAGAQSLPTCGMSPASVTLANGGTGTSTLTVYTTAALTSALATPLHKSLWEASGGGALLAVVLMFGIPSRRRRLKSMLVLVLLAFSAFTIGCGGGGSGQTTGTGTPATTAGTYTFTVAGTDSVNAKITSSTNVAVVVQ